MTSPTVVTVVQARMGSSRLPGKVLLPLGDTTVLGVMVERLRASRLAGTLVIATTTDDADLPIVAHARALGVTSHRGHPTDLVDRHLRVAERFDATHIVKIPSDCPLIDPATVDAVIGEALAHRGHVDYVSNLHPPTWPDGQDVEVMTREALECTWWEAQRPFEREHTTPFLWDQPHRFRLRNVTWPGPDCSATHRVVLDYAADHELLRHVHAALSPRGLYGAPDIVAYLDTHPDVQAINAAHRGYQWYHAHADSLRTMRRTERAASR
jgi:spore coat polysaccharide biosynthesis protein SpsF